jgi:hypothetical protein
MAVGEGRPGCREPIICIVLLIAHRSCKSLHLLDFFFITNMRVFQGE